MKVIDFVGDGYCLIENDTGTRYVGKGQFWFDVETHQDVRYSGTIQNMELERQRQLAIAALSEIDEET